MDEGKLLGRGVSFPPRLGPDGRWAWSSGAQNIRECIQIILSTEARERLLLPDFGGGLRAYLFQPNTVTTHRVMEERITRSLARWEPRIAVESVTVESDPANAQQAFATIRYRLIARDETDQISLSVNLAT